MSEEQTAMEKLMAHFYADDFDSLNLKERWLYAVCWFLMETDSNALHGYFSNQAGGHCQDALRGLELVGAAQTADILLRATTVFPNSEVPRDDAKRRAAVEALPESLQRDALNSLTDELFAETEDVAALIDTYVRQHRDEFPALYGPAEGADG